MRDSNKIQNHQIQAAHRVDLGALYSCLRVLQIPFAVLFIFNRAMPTSQGSRSRSRPTYFYFTFHWIKIR